VFCHWYDIPGFSKLTYNAIPEPVCSFTNTGSGELQGRLFSQNDETHDMVS